MSYLLDTNVLAEVRKPRPNVAVQSWFADVAAADLFVSVLTLGEIRQGVERLRRRDPRQAAVHDSWLEALRRQYRDRILPVSDEVALEWGRLNGGDPLSVVDGLLAATAFVHRLTLVTRNVSDVERTGVPLLNPFDRSA